MKHRLLVGLGLATALIFSLTLCSGDVAAAEPGEATFTVDLPCSTLGQDNCLRNETIEIPEGRPVYALLVSGFHQNKELDMFHFYEFAKCLLDKDAYVHYAWWNNLLLPYMEGPLHNDASVPSHAAFPVAEILNALTLFPGNPAKANPRDDYQFQVDAQKLLTKIREHNPDALIVLAGHSMGGDAVARLASNAAVDIALVAPIDPVGNRSCVALTDVPGFNFCQGLGNFTRWRATHLEYLDTFSTAALLDPPRRAFGPNVKYLYHRWQHEFLPPFDFECGPGADNLFCVSGKPAGEYLFRHHYVPDPPAGSIDATNLALDGGANVQFVFDGDPFSNREVNVFLYDVFGGLADGHGELVGFRGTYADIDLTNLTNLFAIESYPMALTALGGWPKWTPGTSDPTTAAERVGLMKAWDKDPNHLYKEGYEPWNPGLCHVSRDLCKILDELLPEAGNQPPVADAGTAQVLECAGHNGTRVTLDGSGSTDPDGDPLSFAWSWPGGTATGEFVDVFLPLGTHTIVLTVDDGNGGTDTDTVTVTIEDTTPARLNVSLSPDTLWPPNHRLVEINASLDVVDACDPDPTVTLVSIVSDESDNDGGDGNTNGDIQGADYGTDDRRFFLRAERSGRWDGRVYSVVYGVVDASGNATEAAAMVLVVHDRGGRLRR